MKSIRHVGVVFLLDNVSLVRSARSLTTCRSALAAEQIGPVIRMIERRSIPATFATADPLQHPWVAKVRRLPFAELALLVPATGRAAWGAAAMMLENCRDAGLELNSGVLLGSQLPGAGQRLLGLESWAYWQPQPNCQAWVQPWRDRDCWQIPLSTLRCTPRGSTSRGWWRAAAVNREVVVPAAGRHATWIVPLESTDLSTGGPCGQLVQCLYDWMCQGQAEVETLSQLARRLSAKRPHATQMSILRAA